MKELQVSSEHDLGGKLTQLRVDALKGLRAGLDAVYITISRESQQKRSNDQNRLLWPLLNDFSQQLEHFGNKYSNEQWKDILSAGFEGATQYAPNLDGTGLIAFGVRTSKYGKKKFSEFIEFIYAEGVTRGVTFSEKSGQAMSEVRG